MAYTLLHASHARCRDAGVLELLMHTSKVLRSQQFRVVDEGGLALNLTAGLSAQDRLGIVSPRYEDAILGASAAILLFVTAFYDLQRAAEEATGQPFFIYADYFAFLFRDGAGVRGQGQPAPLLGPVSKAYGELDVWPEEKWVAVEDEQDLWAQVGARGITHLLLPAYPASELGGIPEAINAHLHALYRYLLPGEAAPGPTLCIELAREPLEVIAQAVRHLPPDSPAHSVPLLSYQWLLPAGPDWPARHPVDPRTADLSHPQF